jgi:hypothetical protein
MLSDALVEQGHDVDLFCTPGSSSKAKVHPLLEAPHSEKIRAGHCSKPTTSRPHSRRSTRQQGRTAVRRAPRSLRVHDAGDGRPTVHAGIEPMRCRQTASERFAPERAAAGYEAVHRRTLARAADRRRIGAPAA